MQMLKLYVHSLVTKITLLESSLHPNCVFVETVLLYLTVTFDPHKVYSKQEITAALMDFSY